MKTWGKTQKSCWGQNQNKLVLSVDRPTVGFLFVWVSGRPPGRLCNQTKVLISDGWSCLIETKGFSVGRPNCTQRHLRKSCAYWLTARSTDRAILLYLRSTGRSTDMRPKACFGKHFEVFLFDKIFLILDTKIEFYDHKSPVCDQCIIT